MFHLFKPITAVGFEMTSSALKRADLSLWQGKLQINQLRSIPLDQNEINDPFDKNDPIIATSLDGSQILIRSLSMPLKKDKEIDEALIFQAEPLLPYPTENALLNWIKVGVTGDNTDIMLLAARKDIAEKNLKQWEEIQIEPEIVSCEQLALCQFGKFYTSSNPTEEPFFIVNINEKNSTCVLTQNGKLIASHSSSEGIQSLQDSTEESIKRLQMSVTRMIYALSKESRGVNIKNCLFTGEVVVFSKFIEGLYEQLKMEPLPEPSLEFTASEMQNYALPIGLALEALSSRPINFRQQELAFPHPLKRVKLPLLIYFALSVILCIAFYIFGQSSLHLQEDQLKQHYIDLLASMNKSYENFEKTYLTKNPAEREKNQGEMRTISQISPEEIQHRLDFLQTELQASPDSFPLYANVPRVSDVLGWISTHPTAVGSDNEPRIQIDSFNYTMLKRPGQEKKMDKYQVKVELEFSSPSATWAREFHDALIAPNDIVDPKGEVKWNTNRGKYRTSFYLKDKTQYPGR